MISKIINIPSTYGILLTTIKKSKTVCFRFKPTVGRNKSCDRGNEKTLPIDLYRFDNRFNPTF